MKRCTGFGLCAVLLFSTVQAQLFVSPKIRGWRAHGISEASLPIARLHSQPVTLEFDIVAADLPSLELRFFHCDRKWNVTGTSFINDDQRNRSKSELLAQAAPVGVSGYTFHYQVKIPEQPVFDRFLYSGNYIYELRDRRSDELLARDKMFVTEDRLIPGMKVVNRQEPNVASPYYQVHEISVSLMVPPPDTTRSETFELPYFSTVDVYKNREISRPWRISSDDDDPHTFVRGWGTRDLVFVLDNMEPGSEYRVLDLRDVDFYPQGKRLRPRDGADVSRFLAKVPLDHNGSSSIVSGTTYSDYLDFRFELLWKTPGEAVYVTGDFNGWNLGPASLMQYEGDRYILSTSLRRGVYDYQYVRGEDWIVLEGNDWKTTNNFTAMVYYHDPRFGGFDRLVGVARGRSPGTSR